MSDNYELAARQSIRAYRAKYAGAFAVGDILGCINWARTVDLAESRLERYLDHINAPVA